MKFKFFEVNTLVIPDNSGVAEIKVYEFDATNCSICNKKIPDFDLYGEDGEIIDMIHWKEKGIYFEKGI